MGCNEKGAAGYSEWRCVGKNNSLWLPTEHWKTEKVFDKKDKHMKNIEKH